MAQLRSRRVRDAGMGGLVQQPQALGAHRQHPAGRSRTTLLRPAGTTRHGGITYTKWPPANPGRFTHLTWSVAPCVKLLELVGGRTVMRSVLLVGCLSLSAYAALVTVRLRSLN